MAIRLFMIYMMLMVCSVSAMAYDPYAGYEEDVFMDMTFDENLRTPYIPTERLMPIKTYMKRQATALGRVFAVDMMRDDEVFAAIVPTDELFAPNDTLLKEEAAMLLAPLFRLMTDPMAYKILLAVHTDDTGSDVYNEDLSQLRINAVYDLMMQKIDDGELDEQLVIVPFAMGSSDPVADNSTRAGRRENRRLEVYFVPGPSTIDKAGKGTL